MGVIDTLAFTTTILCALNRRGLIELQQGLRNDLHRTCGAAVLGAIQGGLVCPQDYGDGEH